MNRLWVASLGFGCCCLLLISGAVFGQEANPAKPAEPAREITQLPEIEELPNPFVMSDGSQVRTREDWSKRRDEIKSLFEQYQYGHLPPKPERMSIYIKAVDADVETGISTSHLEIHLEHGRKKLLLNVRLTGSLKKGDRRPKPVVIQGGFFGSRPSGRTPSAKGQSTDKARPRRQNRSKIFIDRGYVLAELNLNDVAADNKDRARESGIYQLFGEDIDCGGLMAWAWGMHRVIDMFEEMKGEIDMTKIIVTGHSRYGKAALVAGAFDDRIALTVTSHSGCAGAAPYRFIYGKSEQLHNISGFAPQWFRPDFRQFVDNVNRLPIDQHMLRALVAPRALLATEGTNDSWTNPEGSQLTHLAAKSVYDFLGAGQNISIKFRPVGHVPSNEDLLEFADHVFFEKPLSAEFGKLAYDKEEQAYSWTAPHSP